MRRTVLLAAMGAALVAVLTGSCTSDDAAPATPPPVSAAPERSVAPAVTAAANALLATLDEDQKHAVQFAWTDTAQKQRWSDLPTGRFTRAGLRWSDLNSEQRDAWLAVMRTSLSPEGYQRVLAEWAADDANALQTGETTLFGEQYYYLALIGTPSDGAPWMWQFGGHHVTINAAVAGGRVSLSPSFIGGQPATYVDPEGATVRPLGDIEKLAFSLVNSLEADRRRAAVLGPTPIDLVLGPGQDGRNLAPEGLPVSRMSTGQQAMALALIGHYTGLVNSVDAEARTAEIRSALGQTYFAWYGPTTPGSPAYFRFTGPTLVIEYAPQNATTSHIHGIYRDPTNEYGARYAS